MSATRTRPPPGCGGERGSRCCSVEGSVLITRDRKTPRAGVATQKPQVQTAVAPDTLRSRAHSSRRCDRNPTLRASSHPPTCSGKLGFSPGKWERSPPSGRGPGPTCQSRSPAHTGRGHCLKSLFSERESYTQRGSRWQGHPGVTKGRDSAAGHPAPSSLTADGPRTGPRVQWGPLSPPGCSQPAAPQQPRVSALHFRQGRSWGKTRPPDEL